MVLSRDWYPILIRRYDNPVPEQELKLLNSNLSEGFLLLKTERGFVLLEQTKCLMVLELCDPNNQVGMNRIIDA